MNPFLLGGALLITGVLLFLEWRRTDRRHLVLRLAATLLAVAALARLSLPASDLASPPPGSGAVLWTAGSTPVSAGIRFPLRFALPDAAVTAPPRTPILPDVGTLRRRFPGVETLQILGDGLDPAELPALGGLRVVFDSPVHPQGSGPAIRFLWCPRELPLGEPLNVRGSVAGLPPGAVFPLSLEAPDGRKTETATTPADALGTADFTLHAAPLSAAGRFVWRLHAGPTTEPLGVSVVPPTLPRVLVLEGAPHFDTAALRRWYEAAGGTFTVRTQVGKANTQFAAVQDQTPPFGKVDAALLAGFDLVLADGHALAGLSPEERAALLAAIDTTGLGLLVRADAALLPPDTANVPADLRPFFPWRLTPVGEATPGEERAVRPQWPGQTVPSVIPISAAPFAFDRADHQAVLVSDREDRPLAASFRQGRGEIALTLVRATTRWQRENDEASFAAYWSFLFSRLARQDTSAGRWSLVDGDAGPVFVDHPLTLRWSGPPDQSPAPGNVTAVGGATGTVLPLAQAPREPGEWQGTFWPRRAGWHRVTSAPGGTPLDFYVHPTAAWPALQAERRREATERFATTSAVPSPPPAPSTIAVRRVDPLWWFLLFVLSAGYLWTERRFAAV